jgi:hypothetical protein
MAKSFYFSPNILKRPGENPDKHDNLVSAGSDNLKDFILQLMLLWT